MPTNLPLLHSEPIFRSIAEQNNPGNILFGHKVVDFEEIEDRVLVYVEDKDGKKRTYRAQYLYGADGGKTVGLKIGIVMEGPKQLRQMVSTHFKANVSEYWDDRSCITNFANPELDSVHRSGAMLPLGPTWGRHSEEWQIHFSTEVGGRSFSKEEAKSHIRELLKLPDLDVEVISIGDWVIERVLADSYRKGRVFIGGDSAHRHPPTTGLGLNTAVADAHNIAWKLAYVLKGKANSAILDSYEVERRQIGKSVTDWAFFTWQNRGLISAAIGMREGQPEHNKARFTSLFDQSSEIGRASLATIQNFINTQSIEFGAHNLDLGFSYSSGCVVPDNSELPFQDPTHQIYIPSTKPGCRLPHVWLEIQGKIMSTHDLVGPHDDFLIITDRVGARSAEAARLLAGRKNLGIRVAQIISPFNEVKSEEYLDRDGHWFSVKGTKEGGVILVRPDNIIGWRSLSSCTETDIVDGLEKLLGRRNLPTGHI
jgi:2,4-dichlorophenol 6-monooxygenase